MFNGIGIFELVVLGIVAVLLFGQRLPEVARNVGRGYRELRRNLVEIKSTIDLDEPVNSSYSAEPHAADRFDPVEEFDEPTSPKLAPPEPLQKDQAV